MQIFDPHLTPQRPAEFTMILRDVRELENAAAECVDALQGQQRTWRDETLDEYTIERYLPSEFAVDFDKFIEDIYALSDLTQGDGLIDLLQIDIWSARPQLFEIWVLMTLLSWIHGLGYVIDFLKTDNRGEGAPFRWNLSYSKDSKPCAAIGNGDGSRQFLFYQLYRPTGDMPDISLLKDGNPSSARCWSALTAQ
jgi:hypothetical protein